MSKDCRAKANGLPLSIHRAIGMFVSFLVMLREGVEAALIVGIVASYLTKTGRGVWMPAVWVGILLAIALSLFVGAAVQILTGEFPQKAQELFEALVGVIAVGVLTSMVLWMRRAARSIGTELRTSINSALSGPTSHGLALIGMVFFAVAREGLESVFFLPAIFQQSATPLAPLGALAGCLAAAGVGYGIYAGGIRLNLRRFFLWTGVFILVVAAGILASALRSLHEAGVWNGLQTVVFDVSDWLPVGSPLGALLSGIFGYRDAPTLGEVVVYVTFLATSLFLFLRPIATSSAGSQAARPVH